MARFTQYIGLSPAATRFLGENEHRELCKWKMDVGICYEDVMGSIFEIENKEDCCGIFGATTYAEVEQCTPWASGPIIHTCLRNLSNGQLCYPWKDNEIHYK